MKIGAAIALTLAAVALVLAISVGNQAGSMQQQVDGFSSWTRVANDLTGTTEANNSKIGSLRVVAQCFWLLAIAMGVVGGGLLIGDAAQRKRRDKAKPVDF